LIILRVKKIKKHIKKLQFVKVYISDKADQSLTHFEGIIFDQNDDFVVMCDLSDFNYDGFVVLRKADISAIKRSENEKFFNKILKKEKIIKEIRWRNEDLDFQLGNMKQMFRQLKKMEVATIIECLYESEEAFQIGPIVKVKGEKLKMDYFNSRGEYDQYPVTINYDHITFFRFDSPYANLFFKYAERPELVMEETVEVEIKKKKKTKTKKSKVKSKDKSEDKPKKEKSKKSKKVKADKNIIEDKIPKVKKAKKIKEYKRPKTERLMLVV
jgi:hypothetical protein